MIIIKGLYFFFIKKYIKESEQVDGTPTSRQKQDSSDVEQTDFSSWEPFSEDYIYILAFYIVLINKLNI